MLSPKLTRYAALANLFVKYGSSLSAGRRPAGEGVEGIFVVPRSAAGLPRGTLGRDLAEFDRIVVSAPIDHYVSARVLTMTYISGTKVTALNRLALVDIDADGLAEELIRAYAAAKRLRRRPFPSGKCAKASTSLGSRATSLI